MQDPILKKRAKLALCKDHSNQRLSGKYSDRPRKFRPASKLQTRYCGKKSFRTREKAKSVIEKAKFSRISTELEGGQSKRLELRCYLCFCGNYHVTSKTLEQYISTVNYYSDRGIKSAS